MSARAAVAFVYALAVVLWLLRWLPACAAWALGDDEALLDIMGGER